MDKKNKLAVSFIIILTALILVVMWLFKLERQFYWLMLFVIIFLVMRYKLSAKKIMLMGFIIFFFSIAFTAFNIVFISEFTIRISFVFWVTGLVLNMGEILKNKKLGYD